MPSRWCFTSRYAPRGGCTLELAALTVVVRRFICEGIGRYQKDTS
jgi:hypothetical protein